MSRTYEFNAYVRVRAASRDEADALVDELLAAVDRNPDCSLSLDDGAPYIEDEDE